MLVLRFETKNHILKKLYEKGLEVKAPVVIQKTEVLLKEWPRAENKFKVMSPENPGLSSAQR